MTLSRAHLLPSIPPTPPQGYPLWHTSKPRAMESIKRTYMQFLGAADRVR